MYDYISVQSDSNHSQTISIVELKNIFSKLEHCEIKTNASCIYKLGEYKIKIQGIKCDHNGNYTFSKDNVFTEINLIEINIPHGAESIFEKEIEAIALKLSSELNWKIDWRD